MMDKNMRLATVAIWAILIGNGIDIVATIFFLETRLMWEANFVIDWIYQMSPIAFSVVKSIAVPMASLYAFSRYRAERHPYAMATLVLGALFYTAVGCYYFGSAVYFLSERVTQRLVFLMLYYRPHMRRLLCFTFLVFSLLSPVPLLAAEAGFVPSTRIWFSRSTFETKEQIKMYTVVVNNTYSALDAVVGFYANSSLIDSVALAGLKKEQAEQLSVTWTPVEGTYTLTARFLEATAIDEQGNRTRIEPGRLNDIGDVPIAVDANGVAETPSGQNPATALPEVVEPAIQTSAVTVAVTRQADKTIITPLTPQTQAATTWEGLQEVEQLVNTITTTAGTIEKTYQKTKEWIGKTEEGYATAKNAWGVAQTYVSEAQDALIGWWAVPKTRKIMIGGGIVLSFLFIGFFFRRRGDLDTW